MTLDKSLFRFIWKNSRRQQLVVMGVILASLPFYFASFDIPKRIINDALQGMAFRTKATVKIFELSLPLPDFLGGSIRILDGVEVTQIDLLWWLSGLFLLLVIINGAFKYYINVIKGVLGERILRRIRFVLLDQYLRFRPEDISGIKPSEAASIIKDEVDPIGGFSGDAFILPVFLSMQALTALTFILFQSLWLGLVAFLVVMIQGVVIPRLRREQLRLTQQRQLESRKLAGRIGEIIEIVPAIQTNGSGIYTRAEVGGRLAKLFDIRVQLFKRKFSVKYLNNLLAQVTPFFFYAIGGYLALTEVLSIGQLVAAIAAYKDLPPPIKELIDWDQSRADVTIKYEQIVAQIPANLVPPEAAISTSEHPGEQAPLVLSGLKVFDKRGSTVLDSLSLSISRPSHIALVGPAGSGRDALARALGRQITTYQGRVSIGDADWDGPNDTRTGVLTSYSGSESYLSSGSVRDNLIIPLKRLPRHAAPDDSSALLHLDEEAELSGMPLSVPDETWLDFERAGVADASELETRMIDALGRAGLGEEIYRLGLASCVAHGAELELTSRIGEVRESIFRKLKARDLIHLVEPFDPNRFNHNSTLAENLLFGRATTGRYVAGHLADEPHLRSVLEAEGLLFPLAEIGLMMAETAIEIFADLVPGDPLFDRFSYINADDMPLYQRLAGHARSNAGMRALSDDELNRLVELGLSYVESRNRLQLITSRLMDSLLLARKTFRRTLPPSHASDIEFYQPDRYMTSGTIQDNLLFGRAASDAPKALDRIQEVMREALRELGLDHCIRRLGLAFEIGPSGKFLQPEQRASLAIARALLPRAAIVIFDGAFSPFSPSETEKILADIQLDMKGRTLIVTLPDDRLAARFDRVLVFEGARLGSDSLDDALQERPAPASGIAPFVSGFPGPLLEDSHANS